MRVLCITVGRSAREQTADELRRARGCLDRDDIEVVDGGVVLEPEDSARRVDELAGSRADVLVLMTVSGRSAPLMETIANGLGLPCIIWALGREFAFPSSALAVGALREAGKPVRLIHGPPDDAATVSEFLVGVRAAFAFTRVRQSRIGVVGGLFPNLVSCRYDTTRVRERVGAELVAIAVDEVRSRMREAADDPDEMDPVLSRCRLATVKASEQTLRCGVALHLAMKRLAEERGLDAFALECWSGMPQALGINPCLGLFEDDYILACEGDVMLAVSLLMAESIAGSRIGAADVLELDVENVLTLLHCGGPASSAVDDDVILDDSPEARSFGFETATCRPKPAPGPVTLLRWYGMDCDHMHVARGDLLGFDRTAGLAVSIKLKGERREFIDHCLGNHYLIVPGDITRELSIFCNWMNVELLET